MDYNYWHKQVMIKMGIPFTEYPVIIETEWYTFSSLHFGTLHFGNTNSDNFPTDYSYRK